MRIAFFTDTYHPDLNGVVISIDAFAKILREKGHTVYIVAPQVKEYKEKDPNVIRIPSFTFLHSDPDVMIPLPIPPKQLIAVLKLPIDIIHAHGNGFFSLLGHEVARMKKVPFVMTFHNLHTEYTHYFLKGKVVTPKMMAGILRIFANMCNGVLTPSEKMKQSLSGFGVKRKITVIPNFVNLSSFTNQNKGFLHKKLGLSQDIPLLLSVGRLGKEKNFPFLLEAFKKYISTNNKAHLVIVGGGVDKNKLLALAASMGLSSRAHFTGKIAIKYMPQVFADATIFVFASTTEVHPLVVLEAAASGLPILAVEDLAFKDVLVNNKNGFSVPKDTQVFAKKLEEMLEDPELLKKFGENSLQIIKKNMQAEDLADSLLLYYQQVIKNFPKENMRKIVTVDFLRNIRKRALQVEKLVTMDEKQLREMLTETVAAVRKFADKL